MWARELAHLLDLRLDLDGVEANVLHLEDEVAVVPAPDVHLEVDVVDEGGDPMRKSQRFVVAGRDGEELVGRWSEDREPETTIRTLNIIFLEVRFWLRPLLHCICEILCVSTRPVRKLSSTDEKNSWLSRDTNPGLLGGKQECYLYATQPP